LHLPVCGNPRPQYGRIIGSAADASQVASGFDYEAAISARDSGFADRESALDVEKTIREQYTKHTTLTVFDFVASSHPVTTG